MKKYSKAFSHLAHSYLQLTDHGPLPTPTLVKWDSPGALWKFSREEISTIFRNQVKRIFVMHTYTILYATMGLRSSLSVVKYLVCRLKSLLLATVDIVRTLSYFASVVGSDVSEMQCSGTAA